MTRGATVPLSDEALLLVDDPGLRSEIEALRVSALRTRMLGGIPDGNSFNSARLQRNLVAIGRAVRVASATDGGVPDGEVARAALFAARSYEQLAETRGVNRTTMLMLAALNYELAGYQANAATL